MGLANKLEEMRKEGGDQWLSIWNADATKVGAFNYAVYNVMFPQLLANTFTCTCTVLLPKHTVPVHVILKARQRYIYLTFNSSCSDAPSYDHRNRNTSINLYWLLLCMYVQYS